MATAKQRINISVSKRMRDALIGLAKRDQMPIATKAGDLLSLALDLEEDRLLDTVAHKRDTGSVRWVSHSALWDKRTR